MLNWYIRYRRDTLALLTTFCGSFFLVLFSSWTRVRICTTFHDPRNRFLDSQPGGPVRQSHLTYRPASAGILDQSMGARNRVGIGLYRSASLYRLAESIPGKFKYTVSGYIGWWIDSLESILGLLKRLQIWAQFLRASLLSQCLHTWCNLMFSWKFAKT